MYQKLHERTVKRRPVNFANFERICAFDSGRTMVTGIRIENQSDAHGIIEECMVAANHAAAKFIRDHGLPLLYRIEEAPDPEKIREFRGMISMLPEHLGGGDIPSIDQVADFIESIREKSYGDCVQKLFLRQQTKARYSHEDAGHYLLNLSEYAHFTSPIRRYSDLVLHRIIKSCLASDAQKEAERRNQIRPAATAKKPKGFIGSMLGLLSGDRKVKSESPRPQAATQPFVCPKCLQSRKTYTVSELQRIAQRCNETEERAQLMAREISHWVSASFMSGKRGQEFEGVIIAAREFGLFVNIQEYDLDVFVYIGSLGTERFSYSSSSHSITGNMSGTRFSIGEEVTIRITAVNTEEGKVQGVISQHRNIRSR